MPRGIDRRGDPRNDLTREAVIARYQHDDTDLADQDETQPGVGGIENEMRRRAELEDEYGGGAGDWD
jgi:hypothetical protein